MVLLLLLFKKLAPSNSSSTSITTADNMAGAPLFYMNETTVWNITSTIAIHVGKYLPRNPRGRDTLVDYLLSFYTDIFYIFLTAIGMILWFITMMAALFIPIVLIGLTIFGIVQGCCSLISYFKGGKEAATKKDAVISKAMAKQSLTVDGSDWGGEDAEWSEYEVVSEKSDSDGGSDTGNEYDSVGEGDSETDCEVVYQRIFHHNRRGECLTDRWASLK